MTLKSKLKKKQITIGSWITIGNNETAEIMARSGFDWLCVDMEHSVIELQKAQDLIRIIELCGCTPLVRVGENNLTIIKRVMDAGSHGVIVPMVNSKEDCLKAVEALKYPPIGKRGVGLARAQGYGFDLPKYKKWLQEESILIVQIEHINAVNNLREILSIKEVDGFIVGPYDLSASIGKIGELNSIEMKSILKEINKASKEMDVISGIHVIPPDPNQVLERTKEGYRFIAFSLDSLILGYNCRTNITKIKQELK